MDGWMDGCPWDTALLVFFSPLNMPHALVRWFTHAAPPSGRGCQSESVRDGGEWFSSEGFFFFFVFLFITKTLKGLRRESHQWDAGSERRVVERPPFPPRPPALHSSGTFCSTPPSASVPFPHSPGGGALGVRQAALDAVHPQLSVVAVLGAEVVHPLGRLELKGGNKRMNEKITGSS